MPRPLRLEPQDYEWHFRRPLRRLFEVLWLAVLFAILIVLVVLAILMFQVVHAQ
jgi:hypothetical protein